jgi:hypothetical protein
MPHSWLAADWYPASEQNKYRPMTEMPEGVTCAKEGASEEMGMMIGGGSRAHTFVSAPQTETDGLYTMYHARLLSISTCAPSGSTVVLHV